MKFFSFLMAALVAFSASTLPVLAGTTPVIDGKVYMIDTTPPDIIMLKMGESDIARKGSCLTAKIDWIRAQTRCTSELLVVASPKGLALSGGKQTTVTHMRDEIVYALAGLSLIAIATLVLRYSVVVARVFSIGAILCSIFLTCTEAVFKASPSVAILTVCMVVAAVIAVMATAAETRKVQARFAFVYELLGALYLYLMI